MTPSTPPPGPRAGVVYQHSTGCREAFLPEAIQLAQAGAVALSLPIASSDEAVPNIRQSIFAIRRGADLLLTEHGVDRLGCVGHSAGAMMAGTVSGIDRRFRCFVLESGLSGLSLHYRDSRHPMIKAQREAMPAEQYEPMLTAMSPYDAVHFVGDAAPAALLFQSARFDIGVSKAESEAFYVATSEPKELRWYDTGHVINDVAAYADRARFLADNLDLPDLPAILAKRMD